MRRSIERRLTAQNPELSPAERRRLALAQQLEFIVSQHRGPGLGTAIIHAFEHHYGDLILEDAEWETPDRKWVETLLKLAIEKRNVNSSFPNMCRFVLAMLDKESTP